MTTTTKLLSLRYLPKRLTRKDRKKQANMIKKSRRYTKGVLSIPESVFRLLLQKNRLSSLKRVNYIKWIKLVQQMNWPRRPGVPRPL